ncbi:Protein FAM84A [Cricetulus griseus]|uniref:Protein FAM84A n=1 Tax=Cricetulus griseus TaxID=10029 RepID=G3IHU9_CRIGR|nr:Protein FAM84A [Cricetulus griseus]
MPAATWASRARRSAGLTWRALPPGSALESTSSRLGEVPAGTQTPQQQQQYYLKVHLEENKVHTASFHSLEHLICEKHSIDASGRLRVLQELEDFMDSSPPHLFLCSELLSCPLSSAPHPFLQHGTESSLKITRCLCRVFIAIGLLGVSKSMLPHLGQTLWFPWFGAKIC